MMFLLFYYSNHLQWEVYSACVCVLRRELDPFVVSFALKVVSSGAESADLDGHNWDVVTVCDGEVLELEPSWSGEILDGICVTATAINKDLFLVALRIPELLEGRAEGKASCLKVLCSDGVWLPVPNVSEGQEDAGGDCVALISVWVLRANCSEVVSVELIIAIKVENFWVCIQEFFGFRSNISVAAGVCRGGGTQAERRGWLDR